MNFKQITDKYKGKSKWEKLSRDESLPWSIELIEKFENKLDWYWLSENEGLSFDEHKKRAACIITKN